DLIRYQKEMREWFKVSIGQIPYDKNYSLDALTTGVIEEDNLTIEKVIFKAREGVYVTANLYLPSNRGEKAPAVLFQLGHSGEGKAYTRYQSVARIIASYGIIVFAMDPVGQGERSGYFEKELSKPMIPRATFDHQYGGDPCFLTGKQSIRYFIADAMRGVDYLISRPEVDSEKIGATGNSGGGTMTACIAFVDDRIKAAAPGTFITNREEYIYAGSAQDSEQVWFGSTKAGLDHHELLIGFAPKPYMILAADSDFFPIEGTENVYEECKRIWGLFGKEDNLKLTVDKSLHKYTDMLAHSAARFFADCFDVKAEKTEISMTTLPEKALFCTKSGYVGCDYPDACFLYEENKLEYDKIKEKRKTLPEDECKKRAIEFLKGAMYEGREITPLNIRTFDAEYDNGLKIQPLMWFSQKQLPNFGMIFTDFLLKELTSPPVIILCDRGTDGLEDITHKIREITDRGGAAFVVDLSGMGKNTPYDLNNGRQVKDRYGALDRITKDMFFCGDSLCALRLFELECAVKVINELYPNEKPQICASGLSSVYAELYKVLNPECEILINGINCSLSKLAEEKYYENYNIAAVLLPGVLEYLDI
ncbi:MAG: acetylxylan esterase, partial [Clostridia bacterium]|nr:acetylxylan esterase [Clostridia bacterium]